MNRLRKLAKGYQYMRDEDGNSWVVFLAPPSTTPTTAIFWSYGAAPAECFADEPAAPKVEERTLRSADGAFVMTVWLKDDPPSIEGQIVQQPEGWRWMAGKDRIVVSGNAVRLTAESCAYPEMSCESLWLRGNRKDRDNNIFHHRPALLTIRDAHLAKLEATVAAMPRLADQFKVEDRVVVAARGRETVSCLAPAVGLHGVISWMSRGGEHGGFVDVRIDGGPAVTVRLINLRHEREDERPAEPQPEPPPRKYEDGQCVQQPYGCSVAIITGAVFWDGEWRYAVDKGQKHTETEWNWSEHILAPCPPPLSDAQRGLLPGDKVRVRKQRWDAEGKLIRSSIPPLVGGRDFWEVGTILRSWLEKEDGPVKCAVRFGMGEDVAEYLHNLDLEPAEEK